MISRRSALALGAAGLATTLALPALSQRQNTALRTHVASPDQINLHWRLEDENLGTLRNAYDHLEGLGQAPAALMNAGIFEVANAGHFQPQGLHIEGGQTLRPLNTGSAPRANFYLKPNGVFYIDETGAHVVRTEDYAPEGSVRLATQSGPLLFDDQGIHPRFRPNSDSRKWRNGVGVRADGQIVFAITESPMNFWDFARALRDGEGCVAALYMDGSISQMWRAEDQARPASAQEFAGILSASA